MAKGKTPGAKPAKAPKPAKAAKAAKPDKPKASTASSAGARVAAGLRGAGDTMRDAAADAARNSAKVTATVIDQAEANTRAAFAAMRAAAGANSLAEIGSVQRDYIKEQSQRSMAQAREIGDLIAGFGREAFAQMTGRGKNK
jgi:hypothetical protein